MKIKNNAAIGISVAAAAVLGAAGITAVVTSQSDSSATSASAAGRPSAVLPGDGSTRAVEPVPVGPAPIAAVVAVSPAAPGVIRWNEVLAPPRTPTSHRSAAVPVVRAVPAAPAPATGGSGSGSATPSTPDVGTILAPVIPVIPSTPAPVDDTPTDGGSPDPTPTDPTPTDPAPTDSGPLGTVTGTVGDIGDSVAGTVGDVVTGLGL